MLVAFNPLSGHSTSCGVIFVDDVAVGFWDQLDDGTFVAKLDGQATPITALNFPELKAKVRAALGATHLPEISDLRSNVNIKNRGNEQINPAPPSTDTSPDKGPK